MIKAAGYNYNAQDPGADDGFRSTIIKKAEDKCQREINSPTNEEKYIGDTPGFHKLNKEINPKDDLVQVC